MPSWTKEQQEAIDKHGENIIVSAGAGSGKTAVLSERVLQMVLNGTSVDRLLILTFTKLAAGEMKERIKKKIKSNNLKDQLDKIENAFITTFDSYSLSIVKKYHYILGISSDVDLLDENILNLKIREELDNIINSYYENPTKEFDIFLKDLCNRDDGLLKSTVININKTLDMKYDKEDFINNYMDTYFNLDFINDNVNKYNDFVVNKIEELKDVIDNLKYECDEEFRFKLDEYYKDLLSSDSYISLKNNLTNLGTAPKKNNKKYEYSDNFDSIRKNVNNKIDYLKTLTRYDDLDYLRNSILKTKDYVVIILDIIKKLDNVINDYKYKNNLFTFNDISKMAIKIVLDNEDIRNEIKYSFDEILLDEYQDTNDLQELFIGAISNNNVYCVGDIKQSIYRFRNANPNIFKTKLVDYYRIDLLKNFRSRKEVLDDINLMFESIMGNNIGGAEYQDGHRMNYGFIDYDKLDINKQDYSTEIITYDPEVLKEKNFNKTELEAFIIGRDIKNKVENKYRVFDKDSKEYHDASYSDFSIILSTGSTFDIYKKVFDFLGIPIMVYLDEKLTESNLLLVIKNIFKLLDVINNNLDNNIRNYCYLSVGRSFLFNLDDEYLFKTIKDNNFDNDIIINKIKNISSNIDSKSIKTILDDIIKEFNIYNKLILVGDLKNEFVKLDYLYDLASSLNIMEYNYKDFYKLIDTILDNNDDIKFSLAKDNSNSVKLLNIHKSKGLEYPVCYFSDLDRNFNIRDLNELFLFNDNYGIISPIFNDGVDTTFYKDLYKNDYYKEEISEKIRLFYVALTRAKEKMIIVSKKFNCTNNRDNNDLVYDYNKMNFRNFYDFINEINDKLNKFIREIDIDSVNVDSNYLKSNNKDIKFNKKDKLNVISYPNFNIKLINETHYSKSCNTLITIDIKEVMELGTKLHYYLELIDFKNPNLDLIDNSYFKEKINSFINSDILDKNYIKCYKEYEFIDEINNKHGIIDLLLEYEDRMVIIDYKTKNIDDLNYDKQLNGYKDYIYNLTNKNTECYLYSLIDSNYRRV